MPHSQSHLISLATLLESAEARRSAIPPPPAIENDDDSGLIDIAAMQQRAREERANAAAVATRTPVPTVSAVRGASTDPDLAATFAGAARRKKQLVVGGVAGAVALVAIAFAFGSSRGDAGAARAAIVEPPVAAIPAPPPAAPIVATPAPEPVAPVAAEPTPAAAPARKPKSHKHSSKSKGPKLTKVTSGGTAH